MSPNIVVGEPATFRVSITNAPTLGYAIDMGDGTTLTKNDEEFTYTYYRPGPALIDVGYPATAPTVHGTLSVNVEPAPSPPPIELRLNPTGIDVGTGETVTFQVTTADGRPIMQYLFDPGDGSTPPRTLTSPTVDALYSRPGRFVASVSPVAGFAGAQATAVVIVSSPFPIWILIIVVIGFLALAWIVWPPPPLPPPPIVPIMITATPHVEPGRVEIETTGDKAIRLEIRLKSVGDAGNQVVDTFGAQVIKSESHNPPGK